MKSDCANPSYRQSSLGLKRSLGFSGHRQQQGVALIVVLLVLILIISIGAVAVRRSQTDLRLVSSSQIDTLLLQGADGANAKLEDAVNRPVTDPIYVGMVNRDNGIFGHFINNSPNADNDQMIYCYNPRQFQLNTQVTTILRNGGVLSKYNFGRCKPEQADSYLSARQTVATQVHVTRTPTGSQGPFESVREKTNLSTSGDGGVDTRGKHLFDIQSVSAVPAYGNTTTCYINNNTADALSRCLASRSVPNKQLMERVAVELVNNVTPCTQLGKGNGIIAAGCGTVAVP